MGDRCPTSAGPITAGDREQVLRVGKQDAADHGARLSRDRVEEADIRKNISISKVYSNSKTRRINGFPELGSLSPGFLFFEETDQSPIATNFVTATDAGRHSSLPMRRNYTSTRRSRAGPGRANPLAMLYQVWSSAGDGLTPGPRFRLLEDAIRYTALNAYCASHAVRGPAGDWVHIQPRSLVGDLDAEQTR